LVISLSLLHPTQLVAVQGWVFEDIDVIKIGRANDNNVIIYSAVVSRHHAELWQNQGKWEIINFGANGTYVDDLAIIQVPVKDGMIIRLGNSGPKLQISLHKIDLDNLEQMNDQRQAHAEETVISHNNQDSTDTTLIVRSQVHHETT